MAPPKVCKKAKPKAKKAKKDDDEEFEECNVERIVDCKFEKGSVKYRVKWAGYNHSHNRWVPLEGLNCTKLIREYHKRTGQPNSNPAAQESSRSRSVDRGSSANAHQRAAQAQSRSRSSSTEEHEVVAILDRKYERGRMHYLVKWAGTDADGNEWPPSWLPKNRFGASEMINEFNAEFRRRQAVVDEDPPVVDEQPAFVDEEPAVVDEEPAVVHEEPMVVDEEPAVVHEEPVVVDEEPANEPLVIARVIGLLGPVIQVNKAYLCTMSDGTQQEFSTLELKGRAPDALVDFLESNIHLGN